MLELILFRETRNFYDSFVAHEKSLKEDSFFIYNQVPKNRRGIKKRREYKYSMLNSHPGKRHHLQSSMIPVIGLMVQIKFQLSGRIWVVKNTGVIQMPQ